MNPERRRQGLVITELDHEVLVYDLERHRAHCLNKTAAFVFERCDGKTSVLALARALERAEDDAEKPRANGSRAREKPDTSVVWLALQRLDQAELLATPLQDASPQVSRRELIRRAAVVSGLLLPAVTSVVAPTPAAAAATCVANCTGQPFGTPCSSTAPTNCICTCDGAGLCVGSC
jgi:hypothetical protein